MSTDEGSRSIINNETAPPPACIPCSTMDTSHLLPTENLPQVVAARLPLWTVSEDRRSISRAFIAKDFQAALDAINDMGAIAEEESHHPDFHFTNYRHVQVVVWTHKLNGVTENDLVLAELLDTKVRIEYSPKWLREHPEAQKTAKNDTTSTNVSTTTATNITTTCTLLPDAAQGIKKRTGSKLSPKNTNANTTKGSSDLPAAVVEQKKEKEGEEEDEDDDLFGEDDDEMQQQQRSAAGNGLAAAEIRAMESRFQNIGFHETYEASQEERLQEGFEAGYVETFAVARDIGAMLGKMALEKSYATIDNIDTSNANGDDSQTTSLKKSVQLVRDRLTAPDLQIEHLHEVKARLLLEN